MKVKSSFSVVVRLLLWLLLLLGGMVIGVRSDMEDPLFLNPLFHLFSAAAGFVVIVLAFRAARHGGRELAKGRVGDIPRLETNRLITSGIYSCMRHPMLFGLTLLPLGWALLVGSPTFILLIAPAEMLFIVFMVIVFEELEVRKKFGDAYRAYAREVPMVSFKSSCLKTLFSK